jgi:hypothetical protein
VTRSTARTVLLSFAALAFLLVPTFALAQVTPAAGHTPPDDSQSIKVGATILYDYTYTKTPKATDAANNTISANAFNVSRTYINVTGNISHRIAFRITPDIARESGTGSSLNGSLTYRLKYGFAQINFDDLTGDWKQTWVRLGIQQTPFIDYDEGVYRYRFQGSVFAERDGNVGSSDAGVSFHTNLPSNYGDIHVGIYNGEGNAKPEANNEKSFQFRGTIRPLAKGSVTARGLRLTAFVNQDHFVKDAPHNKFLGQATFEHTRFNAGVDVIRGTDQTLPTTAKAESDGYSFYVTPFFQQKGNGWEGLVRYDSYRADRTIDARRNRTIAGLAYWFPHPGGAATAALLFDFEQVAFANFATPQVKQQRLAVHGLINF